MENTNLTTKEMGLILALIEVDILTSREGLKTLPTFYTRKLTQLRHLKRKLLQVERAEIRREAIENEEGKEAAEMYRFFNG